MSRRVAFAFESFPIAGSFTIARGSKTAADVMTCVITQDGHIGRGECVPYRRYGESMDSVLAALEAVRPALERGMSREELQHAMPAGAARNAVDCALWDLEAKTTGIAAHRLIGIPSPRPLTTAYTISLGTPDAMATAAKAAAHRPLLKVKVGGDGDIDRIRAVSEAAPHSRIILDANEGWNDGNVQENLLAAAHYGVALVEQPLPANQDDILALMPHPVPVCADESVHTLEGLADLVGRYDAVNIKLDKTGGLTAALALRDQARSMGFGVMVGCMVGTSLAMAPAVLLAQDADHVDLDGPLLLARDRTPALTYEGSLVSPPEPALWG